MAIYWFSVAHSLQWNEFVGRSPDFESTVVKAKTEQEGIEKMSDRILSLLRYASERGNRLPSPVTREEAVEWQKTASKRNTEPGTLYPLVVNVEEYAPEEKPALLGRIIRQTEIPMYWVLSRTLVPADPVPFYPESRRNMPLNKYHDTFGPALALSFEIRGCGLIRAVSGDAAREVVRRIQLASQEGGACLPRIAPLLYLNRNGLQQNDADQIIEDTPAWIWQEELSINYMGERHYGNAWLVVEKNMCWICMESFAAVRQMPVERLIEGLLKLAEAMDAYEPTLQLKNPHLFAKPRSEEEDPYDQDEETPFPFKDCFKEYTIIHTWDKSWENPENDYPCLVMPYPKGMGGRAGYDLKLLFPNPSAVAEFAKRVRTASVPPDEHSYTVIDVSFLCFGRSAETDRQPVDKEPANSYGDEIEATFVETMGEWLKEDKEKKLWRTLQDIRTLEPNHYVNTRNGTFDLVLRNDNILCIFTHALFSSTIRLEVEPLLENLRILEEKLRAYGEEKGFPKEDF